MSIWLFLFLFLYQDFLSIHCKHIFFSNHEHNYNSCFKIQICNIKHLSHLEIDLQWLSFLMWMGHVFLFLRMSSKFGIYPEYHESQVAETGGSVIFLQRVHFKEWTCLDWNCKTPFSVHWTAAQILVHLCRLTLLM